MIVPIVVKIRIKCMDDITDKEYSKALYYCFKIEEVTSTVEITSITTSFRSFHVTHDLMVSYDPAKNGNSSQ